MSEQTSFRSLLTTDAIAPPAAETQSVMSRPRPGTRRFYLDRKDIDQLCGSRIANRLRQKIPTKVVEAEHSLAAKKN